MQPSTISIRETPNLPDELFLETVDQAPVAISITDANANILYVNKVFEALTGYPHDEVVGKNESVLSSRSTPLYIYQELWETIQKKQVWQGTLVNNCKNGDEYLAELIISPVLDEAGDIAYYLGMHRDITDVHQLEQKLHFQTNLSKAAFDAAPMIVAMVGTGEEVLQENHAYQKLAEELNHNIVQPVSPASLFLEALTQQTGLNLHDVCGIGETFTNVEIRIDSPNFTSPRWFSCSGVRMAELDEAVQSYFKPSGKPGCCLLLIANEVTASRQQINEARLNMIRTRMSEQQMVQTMREAISGATFKLQEPLNVIKAALAVPGSGTENQRLREVLQQALESGDEAVENLKRSVPNTVEERTSNINLNEIIHEVLKLLTNRLLSFDVVVDWRPSTLLPMMHGRANALRGLFHYLISNAISAVNESDQTEREIRIETKLEHRSDEHPEETEIVVAVMDNGAGISEAQRLKVFEPFFCGWHQPGEHAGMGLTMAQEIVLDHNGSIEIDPDFLGGCRIFVRLPIAGLETV